MPGAWASFRTTSVWLGLEPAYKDGYHLPLLGMMK
jgi:hypothetical protein